MHHSYEQKIFVIGVSEMLQNDLLPEGLRPILFDLITELIKTMLGLKEQEEKELKKKAKKEIHPDDSDSDLSDEDDDDNLLDDEEEDESDEAVDGDQRIVERDLGFVNEEKKGNNMESDEDEVYGSEDENAGDYMVSSKKFDFFVV